MLMCQSFAFVYGSVHFNSYGYFTQFAHENCQIPVELKNREVMIFFSNIVFLGVWVYHNYLQQPSISPVAVQ